MNEQSGPVTTTRPEVAVEAPEGSHELRISREFDAPPAAVYAAHVDPALFVQWIGPDDVVSVVGYAEASSLIHAHRRWTGRTPRRREAP